MSLTNTLATWEKYPHLVLKQKSVHPRYYKKVIAIRSVYAHGGLAIILYELTNAHVGEYGLKNPNYYWEKYTVLTVWINESIDLQDDEAYIKSWAENEDVMESLIESGFLTPIDWPAVPSGFVFINAYRVDLAFTFDKLPSPL